MLDLESTIPDGRPVGRTEKMGIEPATAKLELGLGLSNYELVLRNVSQAYIWMLHFRNVVSNILQRRRQIQDNK